MRSDTGMRLVREYMEAHIGEVITAEELAAVSGLSFYHFCHVFTSFTGLSVAAYLRGRRLELAAGDILAGKSVEEVSKRRGFETTPGFAKAFRKQYGLSPTEYKAARGGFCLLEPEIAPRAAFRAVGYELAPPEGDFDVLDTGAYWAGRDFSAVSKADYAQLSSGGYGEVGMWMHPDHVSGEFYYFFGPVVKGKPSVPEGMRLLRVPAAEYAAFKVPKSVTLDGLKENVRRLWKYIFVEWFDGSGYTFNERGISFEFYHGADSFIYIPVTREEALS